MAHINWQLRLLPFVLIAYALFSIGYGLFFYYEIRDIQQEFGAVPGLTIPLDHSDTVAFKSEAARLELIKWRDRVALEENAFVKRYTQGKLLILARLKLILFSFALGSITFLIGSMFILSRITEAPSDLGIQNNILKAQIKSGSPGIILSFLGTLIMLTCILVKADINITDEPLYIPYSADVVPIIDTLNTGILQNPEFSKKKHLPKPVNDSVERALKSSGGKP
jgi:hypothetical protein